MENKKQCEGCVHEERPYYEFPCNDCRRAKLGECDMYIKKEESKND